MNEYLLLNGTFDQHLIIPEIEKINAEQFGDLDGQPIISVSNMIEFVAEPFDKVGQAAKCETKGKQDPNYKYAGMSADEIIAQWEAKADASRHYGQLLDEYTECVFEKTPEETEIWKLDNNYDYDERLRGNCLGFEQFISDLKQWGFIYVGRELTMYGRSDNGTITAGRMDCLFVNPAARKLFIIDWKTTEDIATEAFRHRTLKGPAFSIEDCNMGKYSVQLYDYVWALCNTYHLLPAENIVCSVVNLLRTEDPKLKRNYKLFKPLGQFSTKMMSDIADFAVRKRELIKKAESLQKK